MIINADTVRGIIMELKNLNFDEIVSQYTTRIGGDIENEE